MAACRSADVSSAAPSLEALVKPPTAKAPRSKRPRGLAVISTRCPGEPGVAWRTRTTTRRTGTYVLMTQSSTFPANRNQIALKNQNNGPALTMRWTTTQRLPAGRTIQVDHVRPVRTRPCVAIRSPPGCPGGTLQAETRRADPPISGRYDTSDPPSEPGCPDRTLPGFPVRCGGPAVPMT